MSLTSVSLNKARETILKMFKANQLTIEQDKGIVLVPFMVSPPGIGKTSMGRAIAKEMDYKYIDIRLAEEDPTLLAGAVSIQNGRTVVSPTRRLPLSTDPLPLKPEFLKHTFKYNEVLASGDAAKIKVVEEKYCYKGWIIGFDELPNAVKAVANAAYKILLEREVGDRNIHPKALMMAMGNAAEHKAGTVGVMGTALRSRLCHISVQSHAATFLDNISAWGWDSRLQAFLNYDKGAINDFDTYVSGAMVTPTFSCERTWDMVNSYLRANYPDDTQKVPMDETITLTGMCGSIAAKFVSFTQCADGLPSIEDIIADPHNTRIPDNEGSKYMLLTSIASHIDESNASNIMVYVERLGSSFSYLAVKMASKKNPDIFDYPSILDVCDKHADMISRLQNIGK